MVLHPRDDNGGHHDPRSTTDAKPTTTAPKPAPRKTATTPTAGATLTTRKAPAKKAPAKKEFAPTFTDKGRLDHTNCGHDRTPKGRTACRAEAAKAAKK